VALQPIWAYQQNFDFRTDMTVDSPFYVALEGQRGDYSRGKILSKFGLDAHGKWRAGAQPQRQISVLFGGHVGCGKSTELRQLGALLKDSYTVCALELTNLLDINNLRFSDLLIALGHEVVATCDRLALPVEALFVKPVLDWFDTRIIKKDIFTDLEAEVRTEAKTAGGIPFLATLMAVFTAKVRTGASYREELRKEVNNGFTQLLASFNALIAHVNDLLKARGCGPMLFVIDGTDRLKREDSKAFFLEDVNQLLQIETHLIICAPIAVLLEDSQTAHRFALRERLPMVKIEERDGAPQKEAITALVSLVDKRLPLQHFDAPATVEYLATMSGGHPRDLLRLVSACFGRLVTDGPITREVAERAVKDVASEYQRSILAGDWQELAAIDASAGEDIARNEVRMRMLYDLVLLEYNSYWWRSHPLVRTLRGYAPALAARPSPLAG
jgi:energy-coupling factor transporter ATP-binding protein EcfA2